MKSFGLIEQYKNYVRDLTRRKLVLFGGGAECFSVINNYYRAGEVYEIWDSNPNKWGKSIYSIPIKQPPCDLSTCDAEKYVVLITPQDANAFIQICDFLHQNGFYHVYPSGILTCADTTWRYRPDYGRKFHEFDTYALFCENEDKIRYVRGLFSEEKSVYIYDQLVEKAKYNIGGYKELCENLYGQYFYEDFLTFGKEEVFVDAGAFHGEDTIKFAKALGGAENLKRSYLFEPDEVNYGECAKELYKFFSINQLDFDNGMAECEKFTLLRSGLYDKPGRSSFASYSESSAISKVYGVENGGGISLVRLDDVIPEWEKVTYIKMDIEGSEIPALEGARNIITKHKPKLAICSYHMLDDLWNIPMKIHEICPDYKFYIRCHTPVLYNKILYAVMD